MTWKSHIDLIYVVNIRDYNVTHHKINYKTVCHRFNVLSVVSYLHAPCKMNIIFFVLYDTSNSDLGFVYLCVCGMI